MTDHEILRHELVSRYGNPARLPDDEKGIVFVFAHESREAAEAYALANIQNHSHRAYAEERNGTWVSVVDISRALKSEELNGGLFDKYFVMRNDHRDLPGGDKEGAKYFVLDIAHDPFARTALASYVEACKYDYPDLANDLIKVLEKYDG
jgi:hypothetical protein